MKLATYLEQPGQGQPTIGVVRDDGIVPINGDTQLPANLAALLHAGGPALAQATQIGAAAINAIPLDAVTLLPPIPRPGKMLAIGLNYADHVEESGMQRPEHQLWFNKQHNCVNGPYADIVLPKVSTYLDYEAELCVIIGRRCKHVPRERAHEVIGGYCVGNDVSVRDWQLRVQTMQIGKSFDTHGPIGPWLVTPDELGDPHQLDIRSYVNGELRQSSNTRHLIFDCYDAIAHLSQAFTLDPGDVLFMGTPSGVGGAMKPPQFLKAGDVVRVEIDSLGHIENTVVPEQAHCVIN